MALVWHLCLLAFYWRALVSWKLSYALAYFASVCVTVLGMLWGKFQCSLGQWFTQALQFLHAALHVLLVYQCIVFGASCSVLVFFPLPSHPLLLLVLLLSLLPHWTLGSVWQVLGQGLGVAGRDRGWVVGRAGLWGVLATWVKGRWFHPPGS